MINFDNVQNKNIVDFKTEVNQILRTKLAEKINTCKHEYAGSLYSGKSNKESEPK